MEKKKLTAANGRPIADNQNLANRRSTRTCHVTRPMAY